MKGGREMGQMSSDLKLKVLTSAGVHRGERSSCPGHSMGTSK